MTTLELIKEWIKDNPFIWSIVKFIIVLVIVLSVIQIIRGYLKRKISNTVVRYKAQKGIEIFGYVLLVILAITYFSGSIKDFTIIIAA